MVYFDSTKCFWRYCTLAKWSFQEDYIVCNFCKEQKCADVIGERLDELMLRLKDEGFNLRSKIAVQKRARGFTYLFRGWDVPQSSRQIREMVCIVADKEINPEWYQWVEMFIRESSLEDNTHWPTWLFEKTSNIINLESLPEDEFGPTFKKVLFGFIDSKGLDEPDVYTAAHVDRSTFTRIRKNTPISKKTAMALCFGLQLTLDEAQVLLQSAGHSFCSNPFDRLVAAYLKAGKYDIMKANIQLYDQKLPLLF